MSAVGARSRFSCAKAAVFLWSPTFRRELNIPVILMGYGLNTDGAHGPDEHFSVEMFQRGIQTAICYLEEAAH